MNNNICKKCGNELIAEKCNNCGYTSNISNTFENVTNNRHLKEQLEDSALSLLANNKLISLEKDTKHLI